jgi:hypothetical protein
MRAWLTGAHLPGPLLQLSTERVVSETHCWYVYSARDLVIRIDSKHDGHLRALINQGRFQFLAAECVRRKIELELLCVAEGIPAWVSHIEKDE